MGTSDDLQRWAHEGLITEDEVTAILAFESQRHPAGRMGRGVEAVAYLGGSLILLALGMLTVQFWDRMELWGRLALSVLATIVLFGAGLLFGRSGEPALRRAQTFVWFLTVGGVALVTNVLIRESFGVEQTGDIVFLTAAVSVLAAIGLWWSRRSALQMLAMGLTAGVTVVSGLLRFESLPEWVVGLSLAVLGSIWLLLTWAGVFTPTRTSYALGGIGTLLVAFPQAPEMPWPVVGLLAGLGLMAISVRLDQNVLLGLGVAGLFVYIPMIIFEWFGESLGVPVALLIAGVILIGVVVATVRLRAGRAD